MNRGLWRAALIGWMAASLIVSPMYAQSASGVPQAGSSAPTQNPLHVQPAERQSEASQSQSQDQSQTQGQSATQQQGQSTTPPQPVPPTQVPQSQESTAVGPIAPKRLPLGHDYAKGKPLFPNPFTAYSPIKVGPPTLTNTPKIDQLIQDGKLMLSLDDAISLALENNLDIRVQRFTAWIVDTGLLKAQAGGIPQTASAQQVVLGLPPATSFDPVLTSSVNWARQVTPVNQIFTSGFGTSQQAFSLIFYSANYNFGYTQGFHTGTGISVQWQNNRGSTNSPGYLFNPFVQSTLAVTISQPLLNGCCRLPNTRFIIEAKNSQKIAAAQFNQAVITDITTTSDDYWELVFDRANVKVEDQAVSVSQKLYEDNKKRLEIGTMAPLDVITAESQLANDKQQLVVAQTAVLLQEAKLLSDITKDPLASNLAEIDIVPTTPISTPEVVENVPLDTLMAEAWQNRPEMTQTRLTLENDKIEVKTARNALLPSLTLIGQYQGVGLAGLNTTASSGTTPANVTANLLNEQANASVFGPQALPTLPIAAAASSDPAAVTGVGTALRNMINASSPTYFGGLTFSMPIRNRSAQADSARAIISERQEETLLRQLQNTIFVNVRQAQVNLEQDRAQVAATSEARKLAQQTLDAEQKKYQLGSSDSYTVVLRARDLTVAEANELRAQVNLIEAEVLFNQAMGRTLDANKITLADAFQGKVSRTPNIPGALDADDPADRPDTWSPGKK